MEDAMRSPSRMGWLWLPLALVAFMASCGADARPEPTGTSFKIVRPAPSVVPAGLNAQALQLAKDMVEDVELAEACQYGNPGCDDTAYLRVRKTIDAFKAASHCSVLRIRVGASTDKEALTTSGENMALVQADPANHIGAAFVVVDVRPGVVLLIPPGKQATAFGVLPVIDCSEHPAPGLGDGL